MRSPAISFLRFAAGVPGLLKTRLTLADARRQVDERLAHREENFLATAERFIYGNPSSPYRPLLEVAGCELGDLRAAVRGDGIDATLRRLRGEGVYVSFEEFKGRTPVVRGGRTIPVRPSQFVNPRVSRAIASTSGGSSGPATQVPRDLMTIERDATARVLTYAAHGVLDAPTASWRQQFPSPDGIGLLLEDAKHDQVHERWFAPPSAFRSVRYPVARELVYLAARVGGVRLPRPEVVDYGQAGIIAAWAADAVRRTGRALVRCGTSHAVRVALAAVEGSLDLAGVTFIGGAEPATPAKVATVAASGARHAPIYGSSETGKLGAGCSVPSSSNDLHFFTHTHAVIQHQRPIGAGDESAETFLFTTVTSDGPTILLNVESDDYGRLETRSCGCALEVAGLKLHVRDIFSFSKLTGEGVTLVGSDLLGVVEHVLPDRFGGTMFDYQLVEEEDDRGLTRLTIVVSPRVAIDDEADLIDTVLSSLGKTKLAADVRHTWQRAGALRVRREEPRIVGRGKHEALVKSRLRG